MTGYVIAQSQAQPGVQKFNFDGELCWSTSVMINESFNYLNSQSVVTESGDWSWSILKLTKFSQTGEDIPDLSIPELQIRQNFPNPFNNQTSIIYRIPDLTHVILKGYDLNGRLVVDNDLGQRAKGEYTYFIDSRYLASGTYYYHVKTDTEAGTGKMVLVK